METIRAFTTIEQSRKLAEVLPLESADMYYPWYIEEDGDTIESGHRITTPDVGNFTTHKVNKMILPCWSLAALLSVLPRMSLEKEKFFYNKYFYNSDYTYRVIVNKYTDNNIFGRLERNPIDACVAMIEKLHELKML